MVGLGGGVLVMRIGVGGCLGRLVLLVRILGLVVIEGIREEVEAEMPLAVEIEQVEQ